MGPMLCLVGRLGNKVAEKPPPPALVGLCEKSIRQPCDLQGCCEVVIVEVGAQVATVQVFAKDRAQGTAGGDIGDDAEHYQHENINLNDDMAFFEMATDDFVMSTEEPIPTQSPMVSDAEMVGPGFQALADSTAREEAREAAREAREAARIEAEKVVLQSVMKKITLLG
ncbi:uncharacterized protein LOC120251349 [Dioscorea cayenensis subsp. rotundata]|uniref:Uncharacterized protein LOC120251349 n=1 Tax=Dioscorea cayennensis subsp. rotundata TaxID=55577 RepID=A0AB40ALP3_DIOCR|nr:uncharacterized protein LOC120251349 [Dioscorea cayenensis subsp. rotundata]